MSSIKLLFVEDREDDVHAFRATVKRYQKERRCAVDVVVSRNLEEAQYSLDSSFDGAVIDLKLGNTGYGGNELISKLRDSYRIPIAVFTGNPKNVTSDFDYIDIYIKGKDSYEEMLDEFFRVYNTGLTRITGGRGIIEKTMGEVFWKNIVPRLDSWKAYVKSGNETEKAILRFMINHLLEILDDDAEQYFPEEMYIYPPVSKNIRTGSIVSNNQVDGKYFLVMTPLCDLVIRGDGKFKTDHILLCEIEKSSFIQKNVLTNINKKKSKNKKLLQLYKNSYTHYYHFLPETKYYLGGFINFRKLLSHSKNNFKKNFSSPCFQISSPFIKDIVSRFSSYYARQGQPDILLSAIMKKGTQ